MNATPFVPPTCSEHPAEFSGWRCDDCSRELCPDCVARETSGVTAFECCVHCDGRASVRKVPGSRESYGQLFLLSLKVPIGWVTGAVLVGVWALVYLAWRLPTLGSGLAFALLLSAIWALFFAVMKAASDGLDRVGVSAEANLRDDVLRPAAGMAALTWTAVLLVWALTRNENLPTRPDDDPRAWALVLLLALLLPAWSIALARGDGPLRSVSPAGAVRIIASLGRDYGLLALVSLGISSLVFFWLGAGAYMQAEGDPAFALLLNVFSLYGVLLFGRLCGLVMAARADALGMSFREDQRIPALPDAVPRGVRRRRPPPEPKRPRLEWVELDTEVPQGPMGMMGFADVDPLDHALGTFAVQTDLEAGQLATSDLVAIGQRAAARGRLVDAVRALKLAASTRPDDPDAPRACVILARIYAERMGDAGAAEKLYRYVVQRYPATPAATFAAAQVTPPPSGD